jgi:hypothetical protein
MMILGRFARLSHGNHKRGMLPLAFVLGILTGWFLLACQQGIAGEKIQPRLRACLDATNPNDEVLVWVYLTDKGATEYLRNSVPLSVVSEHSIQRRLGLSIRPGC